MRDGKSRPETGAVNPPRTLFKPGTWLAKIDFINHLILFNNVLITVLSENEGGKTSFNTLLQNNLDLQIKSIAMTVIAPCDRQNIIEDIAAQLHLNSDSGATMASIAKQVNERKAHVLVVIDDAQHLPEAFIKEMMLAIKSQEDFGFLNICLISDYSVVATLNGLAVEQFDNLIHTIELGALNESETRTYVLQRAMATGLINKPLTDIQFKQLYQLTKGNLAKINANLESYILNCSVPKKNNKLVLLKKGTAAVAAVLVAGFSYLFYDQYAKLSLKNPSTHIALAGPTVMEKIAHTFSSVSVIKPVVLESQIASWQDSSTHQLMHFALPKKQVLDEDLFDDEREITTVAIVDKVVVIPKIKSKTVAEITTVLGTELNRIGDAEVEKIAPQIAAIPANTLSSAIKSSKELADVHSQEKKVVVPVKQLAKTQANTFTIQLVASHRVDDLHKFRVNNNLKAQTKIRYFTNEKGSWYVLTLGEYMSISKAQIKASNLPAELAKFNPWIRPTSGLKSVG